MIPVLADPSGPPDTRPPTKPPGGPPPPAPPSGEFDRLFAAVDAILDDLKPRAGRAPAPGADFRLPRDIRDR